jgi:hypothetical protein
VSEDMLMFDIRVTATIDTPLCIGARRNYLSGLLG